MFYNGPSCTAWLFVFSREVPFRVNSQQWVTYFNRHIPPESDLPRLSEEELERWQRLGLLVPPDGEYCRTDLKRILALLMLERAVVAKLKAGSV